MKFIDPKTDFAFKRIFDSEDSKNTLISFINAALNLSGEREIKSVEIKPPYQTLGLPIFRESIVDVACTDGLGKQYLVEMQVNKVKGFANRIIHNLSKCYSSLLEKGGKYPDMHDVILIAVMDFTLFEELKKFHSIYILKDIETNFAPFNQLKICCLELAKFHKTEKELANMLDKWCFFLKEAQNLKMRPDVLDKEVFEPAFEKAEAANMTIEEEESYDANLQRIRDEQGMLDQSWDDGKAAGIAEVKADTQRKIALKLINEGMDLAHIAKLTGLSEDEVRKLVKKDS